MHYALTKLGSLDILPQGDDQFMLDDGSVFYVADVETLVSCYCKQHIQLIGYCDLNYTEPMMSKPQALLNHYNFSK